MPNVMRPPLARYGVVAVAVGVVLVIKLLLDPLFEEETPFLLFFGAVIAVAYLGGLGPGLLATGLAAVVAWYFFLTPLYSFRIESFGQGARLVLFVLEGAFISLLTAAMRSARRQAATSTRQAREDRASLRESEEHYRFLAEAGAALSSSLDYRETLSSVARLVVPALADWCAVDVLSEEDGSLERLAVTHPDPEKVGLAYELQERYPTDPDAPRGVYHVLRTGESEMMSEMPVELIEKVARDERHGENLRGLGLRSYMVVPLVARRKTLGAITFATAESGRRYGEADLELAEELARRAALAVDNARLYEEANKEVAERKRTEEELRRSNTELEQFAYVASHDLQEPLRMVSSYTQLLARRYRGQLGEDADEFISYAVDGADRMQILINDLLAYSRVGTRGKPLRPTDTEAVFDAARTNLRVALEENNARVTSDELPSMMGDETQLVQLFQNLIENTLKFRSEEPPRIHIGAERQDGKEWLFSVSDNGIGMDLQYAERIFVLFQRLHGRREYSGTGIGLAVCKKIVERHGGKIWVESAPEEGSTFYFTLKHAEDE